LKTSYPKYFVTQLSAEMSTQFILKLNAHKMCV